MAVDRVDAPRYGEPKAGAGNARNAMSGRAWRRGTALILGLMAATTLLYSGMLPAPILDDVRWMVGGGLVLKPFPVAVAVGELAVAVGVLRRYRWARIAAILFGAWLVGVGVIGFIGPVARGGWPDPFALVDVLFGVLVLYGMGARWNRRPHPRPRPADGAADLDPEPEPGPAPLA
jgi:hypothetical protein